MPDGAVGGAGQGGGIAGQGGGGMAGAGGAPGGQGGGPAPECRASSGCPSDRPICDDAGVCRRCDVAALPSSACAARDATRPVCGSNGTCLVCATSADCHDDPTRPICDGAAQKCTACASDAQCADKYGPNPGVCMAHQDSRCATDAETIYVSSGLGCSDSDAGAGVSAKPFCSLEPAVKAVADARTLILVRGPVTASSSTFGASAETSLIGQAGGAVVGATSAVKLAAGKRLYLRDVSVTTVAGVGILAPVGSTLRMERVTVENCAKGGILLAGAAFDISNSTVTGNGPGTQDTTAWGGIYVQQPPATGPARLNLVTVVENKAVGIVCIGAISGTAGILSVNNTAGDISPACGFSSCGSAGQSCGAQP
jgi:hypothetical protein